ncbi:MAG: DUF302 domain-containing protein [Gammaproteobacteria bacterium]|nr:DUF302 domain-containing protein [Gammaproteobacteria bacterium]
MKRLLAPCLLFMFAISAPVSAEELMMTRVMQSFPETMLKLQEVIKHHGYQLSRVQRVDIGLANMGYKTDKYRVVFFGKEAQNRWIIDKHPELIAYLPLKIAIYAEEDDTMLVSPNLDVLIAAKDPKLKKIVHGWQQDVQKMLKEMQKFGQNS